MSAREQAGAAELPSETARRVGELQGRFDDIRVTYEYQDDGVARLRQFVISQAARRNRRFLGGAALIAPFGTGKSETIVKLAEVMAAEAPPGSMPVVHAEIPTSGSIDKVPNSILKALGDPRPDAGRPEFRWQKAVSRLRERQVLLLAVDEFDRATSRPTMSLGIANSLREQIMDAGVAPILFAGTGEAENLLVRCDALHQRLTAQIALEPLDWISDEDKQVVEAFLAAVDDRLVGEDLLRSRSDLKGKAELLVKASGGHVRKIMNLVRSGLGVAATRRARSITSADLAEGWHDLPLRDRAGRNPFLGSAK